MPEDSDIARPRLADRARAALTPRRRRVLGRMLVVLAAVTAAVVLPAVLASRPQFMGRYPALRERYDGWAVSGHTTTPCQRCHAEPGFAGQTGYSARMLGEFYMSLFDRDRAPRVFAPPSSAACSACHMDLRSVSPSGDLNIPHRAHVNVLGVACVRCHEYLVHEASPEGKHTPRMTGCLECHDGRQAKNACTACHTEKAAPDTHRSPGWVAAHATAQPRSECEKCHAWTERWCADCHARRPRSHTADWRAKHAGRVEPRRNCEACHKAAFCVRCHGEVPARNFDPALRYVE